MNEKEFRIERFKKECVRFLKPWTIHELRTYARKFYMHAPSLMKKGELLDFLVKALCGEEYPICKHFRGAPLKKTYISIKIEEGIKEIEQKYLLPGDIRPIPYKVIKKEEPSLEEEIEKNKERIFEQLKKNLEEYVKECVKEILSDRNERNIFE